MVNNNLYKYQFGFRQNHSTSLALVEVIDSIMENIDKYMKVINIYILI